MIQSIVLLEVSEGGAGGEITIIPMCNSVNRIFDLEFVKVPPTLPAPPLQIG